MLVNGNFDEISLDAGSISFNGSTQYLSLANNTSNQMGTGDWTAEAWIYITSYTLLNAVWSKGGTTTDWFVGTRASTGVLYCGIDTTDYFATTGPVVSLNVWHHIALVRSGTTLSTYLDGVLGNTLTGVTQNFASTGELRLGRGRDTSTNYLTGYISSARLVKGTAVYTAAFTPPQSILPAVTGTSLLLNVINSTNFITDGSPNNFTVTNNGTATWNATGPFNRGSTTLRHRLVNPASVSGSTVEITNEFDELTLDAGSIFFNGAQNLSASNIALQQDTGAFTVEAWIYPAFVGGVQNSLWSTRTPDVQNAGWDMFINTNGKLVWGTRNQVYILGTTTLTVNTWSYVALVRSSTTSATLYLNGVSEGTATVSTTQNFTNNTLTIGGGYTGYLTNFRLVKGVAVYSGAFTPPQSILSAVTGTSLLLNVLNSTNFIADQGPNNFTLTNTGTATWNALSPYNTNALHASGSLSFNGTNQRLTVASPGTAFDMSTGDFTIEAWIYVTSTAAAAKQIFSAWTSGANSYQFYLRTNNRLVWQIYTSNSPDVAGLAISTNIWTHVAWSKSGTTAYLFINGVLSDTTTGVTNSASGTGGPWVGAGNNTEWFPGYITDLRVVKGTALYTSSFTPPTTPPTAVSGTSLLLNVTSSATYITDSSTNNFTLTNGNTVTYSSFSPLPSLAVSRQISDGTLQVTTAFDEFTGAPVVDTSLQLWLDSGQTASYPGSGTTWTDLSGQANTGTLNNSPTFTSAVGGGTFLFNGTNQTASVASLNLQQNFTLEAWVNQNVLNGFVIFGQGSGAINNGGLHILYTSNTTIRFGFTANDTDFTVATSTGTWYHMIFTYNSSTFAKGFYLNAVVQSGTVVTGPGAYTGSGVFRLGASYSTGGTYGNGYFEGVKMYNRILTADEITSNFNALRGRFGI